MQLLHRPLFQRYLIPACESVSSQAATAAVVGLSLFIHVNLSLMQRSRGTAELFDCSSATQTIYSGFICGQYMQGAKHSEVRNLK